MTGWLIAWDPVAQKARWRLPMPTHGNGGIMATGGNLVFQGRPDGGFSAYDAGTGKRLWNFDARAGVVAPPITYRANGRQYVTVIAGIGTSVGLFGPMFAQYNIDYRTQARRVLTFAIGGKQQLPPRVPYKAVAFDDPGFKPDAPKAARGEGIFGGRCAVCHGTAVIAGGTAPDLRVSPIPADPTAFAEVVRNGALVPAGMPKFGEFTPDQLEALRHYIRTRANALRSGRGEEDTGSAHKTGE
ncbi:c-type cytochrome [Novosphingobium panipatense]|uniref:c-type cytochrome n=1 Tax=Novosphingobium panipatense TaxID=428991 RepID=UPI003614E074